MAAVTICSDFGTQENKQTDKRWDLLYDAGSPSSVLCDTEGWDVVGCGKEVQEGGGVCTPMADSC